MQLDMRCILAIAVSVGLLTACASPAAPAAMQTEAATIPVTAAPPTATATPRPPTATATPLPSPTPLPPTATYTPAPSPTPTPLVMLGDWYGVNGQDFQFSFRVEMKGDAIRVYPLRADWHFFCEESENWFQFPFGDNEKFAFPEDGGLTIADRQFSGTDPRKDTLQGQVIAYDRIDGKFTLGLSLKGCKKRVTVNWSATCSSCQPLATVTP